MCPISYSHLLKSCTIRTINDNYNLILCLIYLKLSKTTIMQLTGLFVLASAALGAVAQYDDALYDDVQYYTENRPVVGSFTLSTRNQ